MVDQGCTERPTAPSPLLETLEQLRNHLPMFDQVLAHSPPSQGYEPLFIARGYPPLLARGMALVLNLEGFRAANESERGACVVRAIRFLSKPRRRKSAISRYAKIVVAGWQETSVAKTFKSLGLNETEFIELLTSIVNQQEVDYRRIIEIAAKVAPSLSLPRGRKVTAACAAHTFLFENAPSLLGRAGFTWDSYEEDFTDELTQATRMEFRRPRFNPQPASRRLNRQQRRRRGGEGIG
jgi:hypothetical protein